MMKYFWKNVIRINKYLIGSNHPSFIIAEAGVNHNGKIGIAKKLVDAAVDASANAIKFQTYVTSKLVSKRLSPHMFEMLKKYELSENDFMELSDYSKNHNIIFCSTPFDTLSCDILEKLSVPFYKIGSGDLDNMQLIKHVSKKKRPLFLSTGMSNCEEIKDALSWIAPFNNKVVLLHCTSLYPTKFNEANLNTIPQLKKNFHTLVGYSDHTIGYISSLAAVCLGACVIEKHITLDNKMKGPDHKTSLNPVDFRDMIRAIRNIEESFGDGYKKILTREQNIRKIARRSIIAIRDVPKGRIIGNNDVDILRPYGGIKPKFLDKVLGKKTKINIKKGRMITWKMLN